MSIVEEVKLDSIQSIEEAKKRIFEGRKKLGARASLAPDADTEYSVKKQIELLDSIEQGIDCFREEAGNPLFIIQTYVLVYDQYSTPEDRTERIKKYELIKDAVLGNGESALKLSQLAINVNNRVLADKWKKIAAKYGYSHPVLNPVSGSYTGKRAEEKTYTREVFNSSINKTFSRTSHIPIFIIVTGIIFLVAMMIFIGSKLVKGTIRYMDSINSHYSNRTTSNEDANSEKPIEKPTEEEKSTASNTITSQQLYYYEIMKKDGTDWYFSIIDNFGNSYENGIGGVNNKKDGYLEYDLKCNYSKFSGRIVLDSESKSTDVEDTYVIIIGDEKELFTSSQVTAGYEPEDFEIDVSGISILRIETGHNPVARIVDPYLYINASEKIFSTEVSYQIMDNPYLEDAIWYYSETGEGFNKEDKITDNIGNHYSHGISSINHIHTPKGTVCPQYAPTSCTYRIDGHARKLTGRVVLAEEYADTLSNVTKGDGYVQIFCDEELVFKSERVRKDYAGEIFEIDLEGVRDLRIEINNMKPAIRIVDCCFS